MSNTFQKLLNQAKIKLAGQPIFQPLEIPTDLLDYRPETLQHLAEQIRAYAFPYVEQDFMFRVLYLQGKRGLIRVSTSIPPAPTIFTIGDQLKPCHYLFLQTGLIQWEKGIKPHEVDEASLVLDTQMIDRGLLNPKTGERVFLLSRAGQFRIDEVFPMPDTTYQLHPAWKVDQIKRLFDAPEKLTIVANRNQGVFLVLRDYAETIVPGEKIKIPSSFITQGLHERIDAQYSPRRYS